MNVINNSHPSPFPLFLVEINHKTKEKVILNISLTLQTKIKVELPLRP